QGIVHRDIKPANIFLDQNVERVQLMDFGLARAVDDASLTRSGTLAGTPQYMSPEQARAETVDSRSDLFSLGSVLYAMCTGHAPFRAETSYSVLRLITDRDPRAIQEINPDVPDWLCRIIEKLMAKNPRDRFQDAAEVAGLLEKCLAHVQHPTSAALPDTIPGGRQQPIRSRSFPWPPAIAAMGAAIVLLGIVIILQLNKGTLRIESELDGVPIRILQGDTIVESLTVSRDGTSTRISAGRYRIEIDAEFDEASIDGDTVTVSRGDTQLVTITKVLPPESTDPSAKDRAAMEWLRRPVEGRTLDGKTFSMSGNDALWLCVMNNDASSLSRLLTMDRYDLEALAARGEWTLLQHAIHHNCLETTELLLRHGADPIFAAPGTPPPLELAERGGNPALISLVQEYLAAGNIADAPGTWKLPGDVTLVIETVESDQFGSVSRAILQWPATA
ncbi:MAG: protein kinase, partial [Planctomycetaceae bacterium]|nr:protein kinase [Planctomycetaceae bacterium]